MIVEVIVDVLSSAVDKVFDYIAPPALNIKTGHRVVVPFGKRIVGGYVLRLKAQPSTTHKLKSILSVKKDGALLPEMLELCEFMVKKFNLRRVDALRLFIASEVRSGKVKDKLAYFYALAPNFDVDLCIANLPKRSEKQKFVLEMLKRGRKNKASLVKQFGLSAIKSLEKKGAIIATQEKQNRLLLSKTKTSPELKLSSLPS